MSGFAGAREREFFKSFAGDSKRAGPDPCTADGNQSLAAQALPLPGKSFVLPKVLVPQTVGLSESIRTKGTRNCNQGFPKRGASACWSISPTSAGDDSLEVWPEDLHFKQILQEKPLSPLVPYP